MEQLAGGVPAGERRVRPDHDRHPDHVVRAAPQATDCVVDDLGILRQAESLAELAAQVVEVLRPVGTGEAERGGREVARPGAGLVERRADRSYDLGNGRLRTARGMDVPAARAARAEQITLAGHDDGDRLRVSAVDAEQERAHTSSLSGRWSRWASASAS